MTPSARFRYAAETRHSQRAPDKVAESCRNGASRVGGPEWDRLKITPSLSSVNQGTGEWRLARIPVTLLAPTHLSLRDFGSASSLRAGGEAIQTSVRGSGLLRCGRNDEEVAALVMIIANH